MTIPNFTLARTLRAGQTVFSGWCSLPYPIVAEMIGREGFAVIRGRRLRFEKAAGPRS